MKAIMDPVNVKVRQVLNSHLHKWDRLWTEKNRRHSANGERRITAVFYGNAHSAYDAYNELKEIFPTHKITINNSRVTFYPEIWKRS